MQATLTSSIATSGPTVALDLAAFADLCRVPQDAVVRKFPGRVSFNPGAAADMPRPINAKDFREGLDRIAGHLLDSTARARIGASYSAAIRGKQAQRPKASPRPARDAAHIAARDAAIGRILSGAPRRPRLPARAK